MCHRRPWATRCTGRAATTAGTPCAPSATARASSEATTSTRTHTRRPGPRSMSAANPVTVPARSMSSALRRAPLGAAMRRPTRRTSSRSTPALRLLARRSTTADAAIRDAGRSARGGCTATRSSITTCLRPSTKASTSQTDRSTTRSTSTDPSPRAGCMPPACVAATATIHIHSRPSPKATRCARSATRAARGRSRSKPHAASMTIRHIITTRRARPVRCASTVTCPPAPT